MIVHATRNIYTIRRIYCLLLGIQHEKRVASLIQARMNWCNLYLLSEAEKNVF